MSIDIDVDAEQAIRLTENHIVFLALVESNVVKEEDEGDCLKLK